MSVCSPKSLKTLTICFGRRVAFSGGQVVINKMKKQTLLKINQRAHRSNRALVAFFLAAVAIAPLSAADNNNNENAPAPPPAPAVAAPAPIVVGAPILVSAPVTPVVVAPVVVEPAIVEYDAPAVIVS